jgi:hypothetical protein
MAVVWDCAVVPLEELDDELELELDELELLDWDDALDEPPPPLEDDEPGPDEPDPPDDAESYGDVT